MAWRDRWNKGRRTAAYMRGDGCLLLLLGAFLAIYPHNTNLWPVGDSIWLYRLFFSFLFWLIRSTTKWALASFLFLTAVEVKSTPAILPGSAVYTWRLASWNSQVALAHCWQRTSRDLPAHLYTARPIQRSSARARWSSFLGRQCMVIVIYKQMYVLQLW